MIVAEHFGFVIGVDTHEDPYPRHHQHFKRQRNGEETFPATTGGGSRALSWILRHTGASTEQVLMSMEGTGSYGAKLRQQATDSGFQVTEAPVPSQRLGRYQGKSEVTRQIYRTLNHAALVNFPLMRLYLLRARCGESGRWLHREWVKTS